MQPSELDLIQQQIQPLLGLEVWQAKSGWGTFFTLEFGEKVTDEWGYTFGEWHLWVYDAKWCIEKADKGLATDRHALYKRKAAIQRLEHRRLLGVEITLTGKTTFQFDQALQIRLFPRQINNMDQWLLFMPTQILTLNVGLQWSYEPREAIPPQKAPPLG